MKHLDDRVSDLVDDRLDHDERDRALAHIAICERCRDAADMERYAKGAVTSLADVDVPKALVDKLLGVAEPGGPLPPEDSPGDSAAVATWGHQRSAVRRRSRGVRIAAGGVISIGILIVMLASIGAPSGAGRDRDTVVVVPPMEEFTAEYARTTGGLPFADPASLLLPALTGGDTTDAPGGPGTVGIGFGVADGPGANDGRDGW